VHIVGQIHGAQHFDSAAAATFCRWRLVAGPGWTVLDGVPSGQTQTAEIDRSSEVQLGGGAAWGHPLDVHYACSALTGWPQLVVTLWAQDNFSRNEIVGYGVARVPTSPGAHALEVATWRPLGSASQELSAFFLGGVPHLSDPGHMLLEAGARHVLGTVTSALVQVELQVLVRGFESQGVALEA
jgi:B9 domain-containing protein 2